MDDVSGQERWHERHPREKCHSLRLRVLWGLTGQMCSWTLHCIGQRYNLKMRKWKIENISSFWSCCVWEWKTNLKEKCSLLTSSPDQELYLSPPSIVFVLHRENMLIKFWIPFRNMNNDTPSHARRDQPQASKLSQFSQSCTCIWSKHVKGFSLPHFLPSAWHRAILQLLCYHFS